MAGLYSGARPTALLKPQLYYLAIMGALVQSGPYVPQFPYLQSGGILVRAGHDSCLLCCALCLHSYVRSLEGLCAERSWVTSGTVNEF